jgi:uncharacterized protein YciI
MFVIELIYTAPLDEIEAHMGAHVGDLRRQYAAGHFLMSGRKVPRDGGIIIAVGDDREAIETIVAQDPFVSRGLADVRIVQFRASQKAKTLDVR